MVALVATAVSKSIFFITVLSNCRIAVCHNLWVAQWVPSADGIFCKCLSRCISRPCRHIEPYLGSAHIRVPCHDAWHLRKGTVSFLVAFVFLSTDKFLQINCQRCECRRSNCQHQAGGNRRVMGISRVSTTRQTKQSYCTSLHHSNQFNLLNVYSQHSDIIVSVVSFRLAFSSMITFLISIHLYTWY